MAVIEPRGRGYRARVRLKGFPPQSAAFERLTDARRWAQQTEAATREGRHFKSVEAKKHTIAELVERYIAEVLPTQPKSRDKQEAQLKWWKAQVGVHLLSDVTPALLAQCRDRLAAQATRRSPTHSPSSVLRYLAAMSHAFSVAVKEWGWLEENPMRKVTKPKEPSGRARFLSDDERERLLEACRVSQCPHLYVIVVLALSTGMRYGEIMNLTWLNVDLLRGRIILHETKNGERRNVPLTGRAFEEIQNLSKVRRIDMSLVFPNTNYGDKARP